MWAALPATNPALQSVDAKAHEVATELGAYNTDFVSEATITVGEATFQLHGSDGILRVSVVIAAAPSVDPTDDQPLARGQMLLEALRGAPDDFATGGGFFVWDRTTESYQLCRDFRLTSRKPDFQDEIDDLLEAAHHWRTRWFSEVSRSLDRKASN